MIAHVYARLDITAAPVEFGRRCLTGVMEKQHCGSEIGQRSEILHESAGIGGVLFRASVKGYKRIDDDQTAMLSRRPDGKRTLGTGNRGVHPTTPHLYCRSRFGQHSTCAASPARSEIP